MLKLKHGVSLMGLRPEMVVASVIAKDVFANFGLDCIITSALDGRHSRGSRHYVGEALDFRTRHIPDSMVEDRVVAMLKDALTNQFDVVLESDHIHIEYDPER